MANDLGLAELQRITSDPQEFSQKSFAALRATADLLASAETDEERREVRSVVIQCRENRDAVSDTETEIIDALVQELGLFPYLENDSDLDDSSLIARETLRLDLDDGEIVLHLAQAGVYARLLAGENVILSAPTSFGKSLLIDAAVASGKFANVLVVVPTLALIDETRRRLAARDTGHKVITHPSQPQAERNIFVLTAERVLDLEEVPDLDLFVLDEFYKLADQDERGQILNQVFYDMRKRGVQYYLLGPNVAKLADEVPEALHDEFLRSEDTTVALRFHRVEIGEDRDQALRSLLGELRDSTLVYCQSPAKAHEAARMLLESDQLPEVADLVSAAEWVGQNFHVEWVVAKALRHGVGIHHGQLPRSLGQFMVKAFGEGRIRFLIATGTLIEGVNTHARHIAVFDRMRPGNKRMDEFTFRNISGRCGRMFHHFSGDVWLFDDVPDSELPEVDIPVLTQPEDTPISLLQHIDREDLIGGSSGRVDAVLGDQDLISPETLRQNVGLGVESQISLAKELSEKSEDFHERLSFKQTPDYEALKLVCRLVWTHFGGLSSSYVRSWNQLARHLSNFSQKGSARELILEATTDADPRQVDSKVMDVCYFIRNIAGYSFPLRLRALDRIQREIFESQGRAPGDYSVYAGRVEGLFLESPLVALDEYGVPPELASKLRNLLEPDGDLDGVLARLKGVPVDELELSDFEKEMVLYAQAGL